MNTRFIFITLALLSIALPVYSEPNLVGTWQMNAACLEIGNNDNPLAAGVIDHPNDYFVIVWQQQGLFKGYVCGVETPNGILFGTINNNNVTITQWDAIASGRMQGNSTMNMISHHALKNPPSAPGTCNAVLTKVSSTLDCAPGPVIPWP